MALNFQNSNLTNKEEKNKKNRLIRQWNLTIGIQIMLTVNINIEDRLDNEWPS